MNLEQPFTLTGEQLRRLRQALEPMHAQYDPAEQMLRVPFSSPGYCTTLKGGFVHPTRESLVYAVALLDSGEEPWRLRAIAIIDRVVALQDQDPDSRTYGIWSWFMDEPLSRMSPPDWNWADFLGVQLLEIILTHQPRLPKALVERMRTAIIHASRSIVRRNVEPSYTNIAIMGTFVTLTAAETFGLDDLFAFAIQRLRRFHAYTLHHGTFTEYNSPCYTICALNELGRMRKYFKDAEASRLVEELYHLCWEEIARHFHVPTRQWSGPHSRSYQTLLPVSVTALIQRATQGRVQFGVTAPSVDEHRLPHTCPRDLEAYFTTLETPREWVETFLRDEPALVGTSYLHPAFALGAINHGDLWNQRRALVAYWGTAAQPSYLHLRFLHDGYDYASALFFSVQREGDVLAGVNFATDYGDTHVCLDMVKNATIRAKDLRLRLEFGGAVGEQDLPLPASPAAPVTLTFGELTIALAVPYARLGEQSGHWEAGHGDGKSWLDIVFHAGEERTFNFAGMTQAALAIALRMTVQKAPAPEIAFTACDGALKLSWAGLQLRFPLGPGKYQALMGACTASRTQMMAQARDRA